MINGRYRRLTHCRARRRLVGLREKARLAVCAEAASAPEEQVQNIPSAIGQKLESVPFEF
jgi:hypothetical protein